jgi:F-type H+-transporting ATPase subunit alpha
MILYASINGYLDDVPVGKITAFESGLYGFMDTNHPEIGKDIREKKELPPETESALKNAIAEFKKGYAF